MRDSHTNRVYQELKEAGMTAHGFTKIETKHLPEVIHKDEHIQGVAYGRGSYLFDSAMLVATDKRAIFLNFKTMYKNWDEVTYDVVAGVKIGISGIFASITLHTRVQDYDIRYVNIKCAKKFVQAIEKHIELQKNSEAQYAKTQNTNTNTDKSSNRSVTNICDNDKLSEIKETVAHELPAVVSTVDNNGNPHASVVHYLTDKDDNVYFLTKSDTDKARNIAGNNSIVLTIHANYSLKVHYISGRAEIVHDNSIINDVVTHIFKFREYDEGVKLPPIAKHTSGEIVVYRLADSTHQIRDFSDYTW